MMNLKKKGFKKAVALGSVLAVSAFSCPLCSNLNLNIGTVSAAEADNETTEISFFNNGYIKLSGEIKTAAEGEIVVITVVSGQTAENPFESDGVNIVYMTETTTLAYGKWNAEFSLGKSGKYRAFVGSSALLKDQVIDFNHINKEAFDLVLADLTNEAKTDTEAAETLKSNVDVFGLENVSDDDYEALVKLVRKEIKSDITPEKAQLLAKKADMIIKLNSDRVSDLKEYKDVFEDEKYVDYLSDTVLKDITSSLKGKNFESLSDFDSVAKDAVIISVVNNAATDSVKGILKEYSSELGVSQSVITTNMVTELKKENINTISALKSFLKSYKETGSSSNSNSNGGGGGGSSFGSGSNKYNGTTAETTETEDDVQQVYVFDDIADLPWAVDAITQLTYRGVLNGKGTRVFAPNDNVTREEFAKIISLGFKLNLVDVDCPFEDVDENDWSYPHIRSAYIAGVVNGMSENIFGYGSNITREDLCVMTDRMVKAGKLSLGDENADINFNDEAEISDYAKDSVKRLAAAGIISGDNGNFNPKDYATRAEAAKIVYLALVKTGR